MKLNFAGLLRSLLGQGGDSEPARPVAAAQPPVPAPPLAAMPVPSVLNDSSSFTPPGAAQNPDQIEIPLAPIINSLPLDLKAKLIETSPAGKMILLQVETVIGQLAFGAVKISFGELRQLAPGVFVNSNSEYDSRPVSLPLKEILARINPALLARRPAAQKFEVAEDVVGPFGGRGRGVAFTAAPVKSAPPLAALAREMKPASPVAFMPPQPAPISVPIDFAPRQTEPIPFTAPTSHGNGNVVLPPFKFTAAPVPPPAVPAEAQQALSVPLKDLAENWPEEIKNEIVRDGWVNTSVPLALALIEPGLKRGRVTMTWKDLRAIARPNSPASPNDGLELNLPLKALAPAFLAAQKKLARTQSKLVVSAEIPNLFFGFPQPSPVPVPVAPDLVNPVTQKTTDTSLFSIDATGGTATDFLRRQTQPKDVVALALTLPGVAGVVVALADGLRVAGEVPAELNADTVAAFLPQIYERVNQSTRELRMGALNNVSFTVGNVPWKIFRVNSVYFAAFGRAGEALPKARLAVLAAGLDRKQQ